MMKCPRCNVWPEHAGNGSYACPVCLNTTVMMLASMPVDATKGKWFADVLTDIIANPRKVHVAIDAEIAAVVVKALLVPPDIATRMDRIKLIAIKLGFEYDDQPAPFAPVLDLIQEIIKLASGQ